MSVITYRSGIMAADSRAWSGTSAPIGAKNKIHRLKDGTLIGATSSVPGLGERLVQWYEDGADADCLTVGIDDDFSLLVVKPDGSVFLFADTPYPSGPLSAPYYSVGSGCKYALGAMAAGTSAEEAAMIACELDTVCGLPVHVARLDGKKGR